MKLIGWLILLLIFGYIGYKCQSSLFSDYSKNYDEEHDAILVQKIADEVIRRLDERENEKRE